MSRNSSRGIRLLKSLLRSSFVVVNLALGAAVLISGCASTPAEPQQMRDPQADFSAFKTFAWNADTNDGKSDQPVSLVDGYIRTAIATELTRKGYVEAATGTTPDLRIEYEAVSAEKIKNNPFRVGDWCRQLWQQWRRLGWRRQSERQERQGRHAGHPCHRPGPQCRGLARERVARAGQGQRRARGRAKRSRRHVERLSCAWRSTVSGGRLLRRIPESLIVQALVTSFLGQIEQ